MRKLIPELIYRQKLNLFIMNLDISSFEIRKTQFIEFLVIQNLGECVFKTEYIDNLSYNCMYNSKLDISTFIQTKFSDRKLRAERESRAQSA